jgi:putative peptidoglycan lipid II flippase
MLRSTILLSAISLFSYLISLVSQLCIAYFFGTSKALDIFILSSSLPTLVGGVISSALSFSLIPYLIKKKEQVNFDYNNYLSFFVKNIAKIALVFVILFLIFFHFALKDLYPSLSNSDYTTATWIFIIFSINFFFGVLISFGNAYYNANKIYVFPLLLGSLPYIFTIITIYLFQNIIGIISLAIGQLIGSIFILTILYWKIPLKLMRFTQNEHSCEFRGYISTLKYALVAMLCFTFFQTSDSYWAFNLGKSNLSYLSYNQRLLIAIGSLIITGPTTLLIPNLTKLNLIEGKVDFYEKTSEVIRVVFSVASVFAVIVSIFSKQLVRVIFQRGSFGVDDTNAVSNLLPNMLIGMVFMLCVVVLFRIMFIDNKDKQAAFIGLLCALCYFCLSGIFSSIWGVLGITYSYFSTWIIVFLFSILFLFWRNLNLFFNVTNAKFFIYNVLSLCFVFVIVSYSFSFIKAHSILKDYLILYFIIPVLGIISILLYYSLMILLFRDKTIASFYYKVKTTYF